MVKFSKQFEGQLVPEWKEAFVDYWQLKKDLKRMQVLGANDESMNKPEQPPFAQRLLSPLKKFALFEGHGHKDRGVIQVHKKLVSSLSKGGLYETELLEQFAYTDAAKEFFARLDHQLNKVNQFYKGKEEEFMERGECLRKQMKILLELKIALKQQQARSSSTNDSQDDPSISCPISCEDESNKGRTYQDYSQEILTSECGKSEEVQFPNSPKEPDNLDNQVKAKNEDEEGRLRSLSSKMLNFRGKNLKINIPPTNPSRTISALTYLVWEDMVNQSKKCSQEGGNKAKVHLLRR